jgi:hypothetical protein
VSDTITKEKVLAKFVEELFLEKFLSSNIFEFEWDEGNKFKNLMKHNVPYLEIEEVFEDFDLLPLGLQVFPKVEEARKNQAWEKVIYFIYYSKEKYSSDKRKTDECKRKEHL